MSWILSPATPETEPAASTMTPPVRIFTATRNGPEDPQMTRTGIYYVAQDKESGQIWNHDSQAFEVVNTDNWLKYVRPFYYRGPGLWGAFVGADVFPAGKTLAIKVYSNVTSNGERGTEAYTNKQIGGFTAETWPAPLPNTVAVDHNTGGDDAMRLLTQANNPVPDADVKAYLTSDYASEGENTTVRGATVTDVHGRWKEGIRLTPLTAYTIVFSEPGYTHAEQAITTPAIGGT